MRFFPFSTTTCTMQRLRLSFQLRLSQCSFPSTTSAQSGHSSREKDVGIVLPDAIEVKSFQGEGHAGAQATTNQLVHPPHRDKTTTRHSPPKPLDTNLFYFHFFFHFYISGHWASSACLSASRGGQMCGWEDSGAEKLVKL